MKKKKSLFKKILKKSFKVLVILFCLLVAFAAGTFLYRYYMEPTEVYHLSYMVENNVVNDTKWIFAEVILSNMMICTQSQCPEEGSCCDDCSSRYRVRSGNYSMELYSEGKMMYCSIKDCGSICLPLQQYTEYMLFGEYDGKNLNVHKWIKVVKKAEIKSENIPTKEKPKEEPLETEETEPGYRVLYDDMMDTLITKEEYQRDTIFKLPEIEVKRPDEPNVLKYISEEDLEEIKKKQSIVEYGLQGQVISENKISEDILEKGVYPHAVENGYVKLSVSFYKNITKKEAVEVMKEYDATLLTNKYFYNHIDMAILEQLFWELAKEPQVRHISSVDPPPTVFI